MACLPHVLGSPADLFSQLLVPHEVREQMLSSNG
jgi:hypothetical protein